MEKKSIQIATINHEYGTNVYASKTREELNKQIADFCREWWNESVDDSEPPESDEEVIDIYFKDENAGWKEGVEYFEDVEVL